MSQNFYITTTLPYVNADPHVGFAKEIVFADCLARYKRELGYEVFFNTGTDEHGQKIYKKAEESGKEIGEFLDERVEKFKELKKILNLSFDNFIRTTDSDHEQAAQEFWRICDEKGYIYKKDYKIKYCIGCELEKTDSELENGYCPLHPGQELEERSEENYFFKFSEFEKPLLDFYKKNPSFVTPDFRFNEIKRFVESGLTDFSISRLKEKMPWGVAVPGDESQVMYVWFDALVNYISTLGWPKEKEKFEKFWPTSVQVAGKDNLRQQSSMWQAMLMAARLPNSKQIVILGFITSGGQKMSKSEGNIIDPSEIVSEYGTDALRYFLLREISSFEDGDFTKERFREAYNANLANGLGNLTARIMKMAEDHLPGPIEHESKFGIDNEIENYNLAKAMDGIWEHVGQLDVLIQKEKPFQIIKEDKEKGIEVITNLVNKLQDIATSLKPFLPETSEKIREAISKNKKPETLFERK